MTAAQMRRAAREARKLAMAVVDGTAPRFARCTLTDDDGGHCALGWVYAMSGLSSYGGPISLAVGMIESSILTRANDAHGRDATVFPLLALADRLDALARSAP